MSGTKEIVFFHATYRKPWEQ